MKEWLAERPRAENIGELQDLLDAFRVHYNEERPHQGIEDATPAQRYEPAPPEPAVTLLSDPLEVVYPSGAILRKVSRCGNISFCNHTIQVGAEWNLYTMRVMIVDGILHIFYGERLIRAVRLAPEPRYYPIGRNRDRIPRGKRG
jgi:hypothetical protein